MVELTKNVKDATYVLIGVSVIGFQQAQARRDALAQRVAEQRKALEAQALDARTQARTQIEKLAKQVEERFEPVRETVEAGIGQLRTRLNRAA